MRGWIIMAGVCVGCGGDAADMDGVAVAAGVPGEVAPETESESLLERGATVLDHCDCEPEVCDGVDNDGDGEIDEDARDMSAWYPDADGDGFGRDGEALWACSAPAGFVALGGDCDDTEAASHPGALERCDTLWNDCDSSWSSDSGRVSHVDDDGVWTDWSDDFGGGVEDAPSRLMLPDEGSLSVCEGTYFVNLVVEGGDLAIDAVGGEPVFSAGGEGTVLTVRGGASVELEGLALVDGGGGVPGGLHLVEASLRGVDIELADHESVGLGAAVEAVGAVLELERSTIRSSGGDSGAVRVSRSRVQLDEVTMLANGGVSGAAFSCVDEGLLLANHSVFSENRAADHGAVFALSESCALTVTDGLFMGNEAHLDGGVAWVEGGSLELQRCDFVSNLPDDVSTQAGSRHVFEGTTSIRCDAEGCG